MNYKGVCRTAPATPGLLKVIFNVVCPEICVNEIEKLSAE